MSDTETLNLHVSLATDELLLYLAESYDPSGDSSSTLLIGPSGVGKSIAVMEAARALADALDLEFIVYTDAEAARILANPTRYFVFVDLRLIGTEPADIQGIPREVALLEDGRVVPAALGNEKTIAYSQTYDPFAWVDCLAHARGVLFLDEITNVQRPDVQSVAYQLALDHLAGFTRFHPGVMIVAAGNDPEESSVANELPAPLVNRFSIVRVSQPSVSAWGEWMRRQPERWDRRILAYLSRNEGDLLQDAEAAATLRNFPTPRTWSSVARRLDRFSDQSRQEVYLAGSLGPVVGGKLAGFLRAAVPEIEELIEQPKLFADLNIDGKYLASALLTGWIEANTPPDVSDDMPARELKELLDSVAEQLHGAVPLIELMGRESEEYPMVALGGISDRYRSPVAAALNSKSAIIAEMLADVADVFTDVEVG